MMIQKPRRNTASKLFLSDPFRISQSNQNNKTSQSNNEIIMPFDLKNKTVLISGANRGIGAALVKSVIENGNVKKVYAAVRNMDSATQLVETYGREKITPIQLDLSKPASITAAAKEASDVEVVINNAGVLTISNPLESSAISNLEYEMTVNVYGLLYMAQAFTPVLKANGGGVFVQLNSVNSIKSFSHVSTYSASKAASYSITQALRDVLSKQGTAVVSVHPGPIATDMADRAGVSEMAQSPDLVADAVVEAIMNEKFHVFPDDMAKQIGAAYNSFAKNVVEAMADPEAEADVELAA
jgi:short-subunit dehydrogenase